MQHQLAPVAAVQYGPARYAGWSGPGQGCFMLSTIDLNPRSTHPPAPTSSPGRLSTESKLAQRDRLARGKLWLGLSNGSQGSIAPWQSAQTCLLARFRPGACPGVDSACGVPGRGCRSKHWGSRVALAWGPGTRTSHGATVRRVQLRHCMFNWTLALTRTEMHGVGICRSSKDSVKEQRLCVFFSLCFSPLSRPAAQRLYAVFQVIFSRQKINTRTLIRAFATCHIPCTTALGESCICCLQDDRPAASGCGSGGDPNFDNS